MRLNVNPNRMEILRLRKRLALARRGHKLLKDKQEQLMKRFLELMTRAREILNALEKRTALAYRYYLFAWGVSGPEAVGSALGFAKGESRLSASVTRLMNLRFWRCRRAGFNCRYWLSFGFVPEAGCPYHNR